MSVSISFYFSIFQAKLEPRSIIISISERNSSAKAEICGPTCIIEDKKILRSLHVAEGKYDAY